MKNKSLQKKGMTLKHMYAKLWKIDMEDIIEINLSGAKLNKETTDLSQINKYGQTLYEANKEFIKEKVSNTWYAVIEPFSGTLIASSNPTILYNYTSQKFPNKLFYYIGLLKEI